MAWICKRLRGAKVWVRCDGSGNPVIGPDRLAEVLYQKKGKVYRAAPKNLGPDDDPTLLSDEEAAPSGVAGDRLGKPAGAAASASPGPRISAPAPAPLPDDAVHVWTDGACIGNPGPMGLGVVILGGRRKRQELSEFLGHGTNNIAELTAILRGLEVAPRKRPVVIYSDSSYALGVLGRGWKPKANQELIQEIKALLPEFAEVRFVKVAGHAGVPENERCDELARMAILQGR